MGSVAVSDCGVLPLMSPIKPMSFNRAFSLYAMRNVGGGEFDGSMAVCRYRDYQGGCGGGRDATLDIVKEDEDRVFF